MRYLLDTNVLSEPLRKRPHPGLLEKLAQFQCEIAISATVWHEVIFGCQMLPPSKKRQAFEAYFQDAVAASLPILPYDELAARWHAEERARLRHRTPAFRDGQIAAVAKVHKLTLVTANVADFRSFDGLAIENWM
ncbi:MAG: type II toxin-antitoxin system VapC family toxin [Myxococcales bacterium]|nr:type II toxin-antitoxin system VapC family toxin [Myxococcales bacterium]